MNEAQPADILVEARRNLQSLMDSGLSREVLLELLNSTTTNGNTPPPKSSQSTNSDNPTSLPFPSPSASSHHSSDTLIKEESEVSHGMLPSEQAAINHASPVFRPARASVSSTSSASSGHASIWSQASVNTTHSAPASVANSSSLVGWSSGRQNCYWCTSCDTRFKRKYDWKRHEEEFHERWKKYPCPEPGCNRSFWGANTFNQHHKASHGCRTCPHSEKVVKYLRKRKYWACGFCGALHPSRERHVEHVARHFESGKTKADWMHSRVIYGLLHQPLIHEAWRDFITSKYGSEPASQPNFSWNPTKTGRAQGFMENECPGQLQDLLEFFDGTQADAPNIVSLAFDLSDIVFPSAMQVDAYPTPPATLTSPTTANRNSTASTSSTASSVVAAAPAAASASSSHLPQNVAAIAIQSNGMTPSMSGPMNMLPSQQQPGAQSYSIAQQQARSMEYPSNFMQGHSVPSSLPSQIPYGLAQQIPLQQQLQHAGMQQAQLLASGQLTPQQHHQQMQQQLQQQALASSSASISRSSLDRALPPPPPAEMEGCVPSMNFDLIPNVTMEDWHSFTTMVGEPGQSNGAIASSCGWNGMQSFYNQ